MKAYKAYCYLGNHNDINLYHINKKGLKKLIKDFVKGTPIEFDDFEIKQITIEGI